jgi:hypothetical protein
MDESLRRALKVPVPAELLVIAAGIAAVYWLDLNGTPLSPNRIVSGFPRHGQSP